MKRFVLSVALGLFAGSAALAQQEPATESREDKISRLVRELGDSSFEKRDAAQKELEKLGRDAVPALEKASQSQDAEVATRAAEALARVRGQLPPEETPRPADPPAPPPVQPMPPVPDMDDVLREMEREMPKEFGEVFRRLLGGGRDPADPDAPQQEQRGWRFEMRRGPNGEWEVVEEGPDATNALGLTTGPTNAVLRSQLSIEGNEGLVVNRVRPGSWAEKSGIKLYDVIAAIDGRPVKSARDLKPLSEKKCKLELYRRAKLETLEVGPSQPGATTPAPAPKPDGEPKKGRSF